MNPTLYDSLGVPQDASRDEIRKAWRDAADRFEPGEGGSTRQFRLFNEAAEVLLDPERRKEYDTQLAGRGARATSKPTSHEGTPTKPAPAAAPAPAVPDSPMPGMTRATTGPVAVAEREDAAAQPEWAEAEPARQGRTVPWPVLAVLGAVTAVAVGLAAFLVIQAQRAHAYQE